MSSNLSPSFLIKINNYTSYIADNRGSNLHFFPLAKNIDLISFYFIYQSLAEKKDCVKTSRIKRPVSSLLSKTKHARHNSQYTAP